MDEDIITLSSDEDSEFPEFSKVVPKTSILLDKTDVNEYLHLFKGKLRKQLNSNNSVKKNKNQLKIVDVRSQMECMTCQTPELVDLVDYNDKSPENDSSSDSEENDNVENHSKVQCSNIEGSPFNENCPLANYLVEVTTNSEMPKYKNDNNKESLVKINTNIKMPDSSSKAESSCYSLINNVTENNSSKIRQNTKNQISAESLTIFTEFLECCGSLEEKPRDRTKLIKKLNKYFIEADPEYIRSEEFRNLIKKYKNKINKSNLYLAVKGVGEELKLWKDVEVRVNFEYADGENKSPVRKGLNGDYSNSLRQQKRLAKIQKIRKKLNHLGCLIKELEKQEVDLSDEEDSVYLKLQRFRERYWLVYKNLCELTNDVDLDSLFNPKIHFSETNYPAINKCIEKWLNKTKCFPDFADIMKILESQSSELNLPPDKDSLRSMAIEIFQKVGSILQIRRKYELWNSFSGFLEDSEDPALKNPELEKIFKQNYQARIKKEQEIYQSYAERQEKEALQPKEVPEEDAYCSPESGNEEEEEIIRIEKKIEELIEGSIDKQENNHADVGKEVNDDITLVYTTVSKAKESKNNFKNCKSLKYRSEKVRTSKIDCSDTDVYNEQKTTEAVLKGNDSDPELILVESDNLEKLEKTITQGSRLSVRAEASPKKRSLPFRSENFPAKKKNLVENGVNNIESLKKGEKNFNKMPVFDVGYCHVVTNHNVKEKRKIFRDLTNLNRLMKEPELRSKMTGLFTPAFLYSRYSLKKEAFWKKRFKINLKEIKPKNQKCALNEEEKTNEKISSSSSRDSDNKESKYNAGNGREGEDFSSQGNGQEEDNNDKGDENRKNGKVEDENDDHEEDEDEEKEDENAEIGEHSPNTQKTERENEDLLEPTNNENHTLVGTETSNTETSETSTNEDTPYEGTKQESKKETEECANVDGNLKNSMESVSESIGNIEYKLKDFDAEESETFKNSLEPICVLKEGYTSDLTERPNIENPVSVQFNLESDNMLYVTEKLKEEKKFKTRFFIRNKLRTEIPEGSKNESYNQKRLPATAYWTPPSETSLSKPRKMSASDEERVKRFLLHSPSSISITPPKKLSLSKPPSQSALQALATLRNLKGISATIVKGKPKTEDVTVIGSQSRRQTDQSPPVAAKRKRTDFPIISNVQSMNTLTPKIVTVQGNVSGFENLWPEMRNNGNTNSSPSSIRISKVWGSFPEGTGPANPGCSNRISNPGTSNPTRKKNPKKQVEYVVLD